MTDNIDKANEERRRAEEATDLSDIGLLSDAEKVKKRYVLYHMASVIRMH